MRETIKQLPTQSEIMEWLLYDAVTGVFTWRKPKPNGGHIRAGMIAGTVKRGGYRFIGVASHVQFGAHRLAWIYVHGSIPAGMEIDHKDLDASNNRLSNLRLATSQQQKQNKGVQSNNRSGLKGAYYHACRTGKKWRSQIKLAPGSGPGKLRFLGYFDTAEEAHAAYAKAANEHFGEFARAAA